MFYELLYVKPNNQFTVFNTSEAFLFEFLALCDTLKDADGVSRNPASPKQLF